MKTAQLNEKPSVLFVGLPESLTGLIKKRLESSLATSFIKIDQLSSEVKLSQYYKIVLFLSLTEKLNLKTKILTLAPFQSRLQIVAPYLQSYKKIHQADNNPGALDLWDRMLQSQESWHRFIYQSFATTQLIFFDGLSLGGCLNPPLSLPLLLLSDADKGLIYSIKNHTGVFSFIDETGFCLNLCECVKRPMQNRSLLLQSGQFQIKVFITKLASLYKIYFQKTLATVELFVKINTNLFFNPSVQSIAVDQAQSVQKIVFGSLIFKTAAKLKNIFNQKSNLVEARKVVKEDFADKLGSLFGKNRKKQKNKYFQNIVGMEKRERKRNWRRKIFFTGGIISGVLAILLIFFGLRFYFFYQDLYRKTMDFSKAVLLEKSNNWLVLDELRQKNLGVQSRAKSWSNLLSHPIFDQALLIDSIIVQLGNYQTNQSQYIQAKTLFYQKILSQTDNESTDSLDTIARSKQALTDAQNSLLGGLDKLGEGSLGEDFFSSDEKKSQLTALFGLFKPKLLDILGFNGQKVYVLVFQDSAELRPTGGFISAIGLLRLEKGRMISYKTIASYQVNASLGGLVTPPAEIGELLGEKNWYFHDSNWDADFPTTAETISWFLEKSFGENLDGVIAINSLSAKSLLVQMDHLTIDGYTEPISSENFAQQLDSHAEKSVVDNQTFVSSLLSGFIQEVFTQNPENFEQWLIAFVDQLSSGQIQIYLKDQTAQQILVQTKWSGLVGKPSCFGQFIQNGCLADSVYQVEANIGINRANAQLETKTQDAINFQSDRVDRTRTTTWINNATSNVWPKGAYKAYVRWYLPKEAFLDDLTVNGVSVFGPSSRVYFEHDRLVIATTIEVNTQSSIAAELKYHFSFDLAKQAAYVFTDQNQSGKILNQYQATLSHPQSFRPSKITPQGNFANNQAIFAFGPEETRIVGVEFNSIAP